MINLYKVSLNKNLTILRCSCFSALLQRHHHLSNCFPGSNACQRYPFIAQVHRIRIQYAQWNRPHKQFFNTAFPVSHLTAPVCS